MNLREGFGTVLTLSKGCKLVSGDSQRPGRWDRGHGRHCCVPVSAGVGWGPRGAAELLSVVGRNITNGLKWSQLYRTFHFASIGGGGGGRGERTCIHKWPGE